MDIELLQRRFAMEQSNSKYTNEERKKFVKLYEESGLTVKAFSNQHNLSPKTFWVWTRDFKSAGFKPAKKRIVLKKKTESSVFQPITLKPEAKRAPLSAKWLSEFLAALSDTRLI